MGLARALPQLTGLCGLWILAGSALIAALWNVIYLVRAVPLRESIWIAVPTLGAILVLMMVLAAVPAYLWLSGAAMILDAVRAAIERRDLPGAECLIGAARKASPFARDDSGWRLEMSLLEGRLAYCSGRFREALDLLKPVLARAIASGDSLIEAESGYFLVASLAALRSHYDVVTLSRRVRPALVTAGQRDARRLAQVDYLMAQSLESLGDACQGEKVPVHTHTIAAA